MSAPRSRHPAPGWRLPQRLGVALALAAGLAQAAPPPTLVIEEARFVAGTAKPPTPQGSRVPLPDTWSQRGLSVPGSGTYQLESTLTEVPTQAMALSLTRLSTHHEIHLNGSLLAATSDATAAPSRGRPMPALIPLPPGMMRVGLNRLEIRVNFLARGGLSPARVGPANALGPAHERFVMLDVQLPQAMNVAAAGLALCMLTVWWRRRRETALGTFGGLSLLASLRNYSYSGLVSLGPLWLTEWLYFSAQVATALLVGFFALALAGPRPLYRRCLLGALVLLPVAGAFAAGWGVMGAWRRLAYPVLFLLVLPAVGLIARHARQRGRAAGAAAVVGSLALTGAGVHDYFFQLGPLPVTDRFWLPFVLPMLVALIAAVLIGRVVRTMAEAETLNVELDGRVAERTRELEVANCAKTRLLSAASHDLLQPIATIGILADLADQADRTTPRGADGSAVQPLIGRIRSAARSMESMLRGLLDQSRLEAGVLEVRPQPVRLADLFAEIGRDLDAEAQSKGLRLRLRPGGHTVVSDPTLLGQILRNLAGNAIRYTSRGGVLMVARRRHGGGLRVQVWDTGRGIAPELQSTAFEEFRQLESPGPGSPGLGLGLSIAERNARLLGARLWLRSTPGRGSCFSLDLPPTG